MQKVKGGSNLRDFGNRVRRERERMGMSQEELAARSGLHRTYVGSVERGERNVGLLNILRIAAALQIHPTVLFPPNEKDKQAR